MAQNIAKFEDILEPRRQEFSNFCWSSRELQIVSPYNQSVQHTPKQHKLDVLKSSKIMDIIENLSKKNGIPENEIKGQVEFILDEIGFKHNQVLIRWLSLFLTKITCKIYTGLYVNTCVLNQIKINSTKNVPVVYVPTHRSYGDFILMSYIFYATDIAIPAIAAGMDFHGMKGMGTVLRNTGAFFMRRSYNNDSLYWDVFRQYIYQILSKHDGGIEFFIEGMRSRSNKSLPPKFGLLFMLLRALITSEVPDILFVPINISYDRIIEEQLFTFELLGIPKPKESTMKFFKALRIIKENYGQIYVDIGKPISTRQFFENKIDRLKHILKPVYMEELSNLDKGSMVNLAEHIVECQKELTILNTFNIIAVILNNNLFLQSKMKFEVLLEEVMWLQHVLEKIGASTTSQYSEKCVKNSLDVHNNLVCLDANYNVTLVQSSVIVGQSDASRLKGYSLSQGTMTIAVPSIMLQLYVNPVLYYLINKSFLVKVLKHCNKEHISKECLMEDYSFLRNIFAKEFTLFNNKLHIDFTTNLNHLIDLEIIQIRNDKYCLHANEKLQNILLNIVEPFLLVYYAVGVVLSQMKQNTCSEKHVFATTQEKIEAIILEKDIFIHPYSLSLDTISLCLESFSTMSALRKMIISRLVHYEINQNVLNIIVKKIEKFLPTIITDKFEMGNFKNKL